MWCMHDSEQKDRATADIPKSSSGVEIEMKIGHVEADRDLDNADWPKRTWDLPQWIDSAEQLRGFLAHSDVAVEDFKKLPVYRRNVNRIDWLRDL